MRLLKMAMLALPAAALAQGFSTPVTPTNNPGQGANAGTSGAGGSVPTMIGGSIEGAKIGLRIAESGRFTTVTMLGAVRQTAGDFVSFGPGGFTVGDGTARRAFTHSTHYSPLDGILSPVFYSRGNAFGRITNSEHVATIRAFNVDTDTVDADQAQGGGITHNYFGSNISPGSVGGRTGMAVILTHAGSRPSSGNLFHVGLGAGAESTGSAGGAPGPGKTQGNLFGINNSALLRTDSGPYWESVVGQEINIGAERETGVNDKIGLQIVQWASDSAPANRSEIGLAFVAQSSGTVPGWKRAIGIGAPHGNWPMHPDGAILSFAEANKELPVQGMVVDRGIDFASVPARFTSSAFASPGFRVDGTGQITIGSNTIGWDRAGLAIGATGKVGTLAGIAAGGQGYRITDILRDSYGGVYEVTAISRGAVTALSPIKKPTMISGAAPSLPIALSGGGG